MNFSYIAVMYAEKLDIHQKNEYINGNIARLWEKILSKIGQKNKELLERKIGEKKSKIGLALKMSNPLNVITPIYIHEHH